MHKSYQIKKKLQKSGKTPNTAIKTYFVWGFEENYFTSQSTSLRKTADSLLFVCKGLGYSSLT